VQDQVKHIPWMTKEKEAVPFFFPEQYAQHLSADIVREESWTSPAVQMLRNYFEDTVEKICIGASFFKWADQKKLDNHSVLVADTKKWETLFAATFVSFHNKDMERASFFPHSIKKGSGSKRQIPMIQTLHSTRKGELFFDRLPDTVKKVIYTYRKRHPHPVADIANGKIAMCLPNTVTITIQSIAEISRHPIFFNHQYQMTKWFFSQNMRKG